MPTAPRRPIVSVVGGREASPGLLEVATVFGDQLMRAGYRLCSGGRGGIMEAVSEGARRSPAWREGRIIGILPGLDDSGANPYLDIVIPTGLSYARNALVVSTGDLVVAMGGGAGTLSEIALAWQYGRPVIAFDAGEGWSARLAGQKLDDAREDLVHRATCMEDLMVHLAELAPVQGVISEQ